MFLNSCCFCMTILIEKVKQTTIITHRNMVSHATDKIRSDINFCVFVFVFFSVKLSFLGVHFFSPLIYLYSLQASLSHENIEFYSISLANEVKVFYIFIKNISSGSAFVCYLNHLFVRLIEQHLRKQTLQNVYY